VTLMIFCGKRHSNLTESGFTLLEMIVAITLVAMMATGLWALFSVSIRSWSKGTEFIDKNQRHRSILDLTRKQIASAYPLDMPEEERETAMPYPIFSGSESGFSFVSLNSLRFQESPGLTLVSYDIVQDSGGDYTLFETEARYTGRGFYAELPGAVSKGTTIFENLSSCIFEYLDPGDNNSSQWVREWDGQSRRELPRAISISMISRDPQGNLLSRYMVVPIQAQSGDVRMNRINPFGGRIRAILR
jgi:prepilin-type N-terminal cleavage/methylation domain-containing protein